MRVAVSKSRTSANFKAVERSGSEVPRNPSREPCFDHPAPGFRASFKAGGSRALIGGANDRYEREAERVAAAADLSAAPDPEISDRARAPVGGGPLSERIREPMERVLHFDLGAVKVHDDAHSDELNRSVDAVAFTAGRDIFFRRGAYEPETRQGQRLIAHELTHVMQQNGTQAAGAAAPAIQRMPATDAIAAAKSKKKFHIYSELAFRKWVLRGKTKASEADFKSRYTVNAAFDQWVADVERSTLLQALEDFERYDASKKSEETEEAEETQTSAPSEQTIPETEESKRPMMPKATALSINRAVLPKLPRENKTRFGLEIEPGFGYTQGTTTVEQLEWIEQHWHEPITIASIKPKGLNDDAWERALDITFDDTPAHPAVEIRTEPRVARDLLHQDDVKAIVGTFKLDKLADVQTDRATIRSKDYDVRWEPSSAQWAAHVRGYKPRQTGSITISAEVWRNVQLTQTIPIGKFLDLTSDEQKLLIPNIPGRGLKTIRDFFLYFAGTNAGQPTTSQRTKATPNIKTPLDTLYQVTPSAGKFAEEIKADLTAAIERLPKYWSPEKLKSIDDLFTQPTREEDFKAPERQADVKLNYSVEWNPKLPFYDPDLDDIRVLLEHRASGPILAQTTSPLRTAILEAIRRPERGADKKILVDQKILKVLDKLQKR